MVWQHKLKIVHLHPCSWCQKIQQLPTGPGPASKAHDYFSFRVQAGSEFEDR